MPSEENGDKNGADNGSSEQPGLSGSRQMSSGRDAIGPPFIARLTISR